MPSAAKIMIRFTVGLVGRAEAAGPAGAAPTRIIAPTASAIAQRIHVRWDMKSPFLAAPTIHGVTPKPARKPRESGMSVR